MTTKTTKKAQHSYVSDPAKLPVNGAMVDARREQIETATQQISDAHQQHEEAELEVERLEDLAEDGGAVTGTDLAAAKEDVNLARQAIKGAEKRLRSAKRAKAVTSSDYITAAAPVLAHVLRGAAPTYYGIGEPPKELPEGLELPALIITQDDDSEAEGYDGMEQGVLTLSWFHGPLHMSLTEDDAKESLRRADAPTGTVRSYEGRELDDQGTVLDWVSVMPKVAPEVPSLRVTLPEVGEQDGNIDGYMMLSSGLAPQFGRHINTETTGEAERLKVLPGHTRAEVLSIETKGDVRYIKARTTAQFTLAEKSPRHAFNANDPSMRTMRNMPAAAAEVGPNLEARLTGLGRVSDAKAEVVRGSGDVDGFGNLATVSLTYTTVSRAA